MASRKAAFAAAQEAGQTRAGGPSHGCARGETIRTASGEAVTLLIVAEGRGPGQAAHAAAEQIVQTVQGWKGRDLANALGRGFQLADQALQNARSEGEQVAVTAAAIRKNRLFLGHCGATAALLVRERAVQQLTQPSQGLLGSGRPALQPTPAQGWALSRGDRVLLLSPGMLQLSQEDGKPYLEPGAIPEYVQDVAPAEAARQLISLALGRDAQEDLSVAIYAAPAERRPLAARLALPLGIAAVAAAAALALGVLGKPSSPESAGLADFGYAVLVEGSLVRLEASGEVRQPVPPLEPLSAPTSLLAGERSRLGLNSTFPGTSDLDQVSLFLEVGTELEISRLDWRDPQDQAMMAAPSQLELRLGRVLLLRAAGSRQIAMAVPGAQGSLLGSGRGILGVVVDASGAGFACLQGTCNVTPQGSPAVLLGGGQGLHLLGGASSGPEALTPEALALWDHLCSGCASDG